VDNYTLLDLQRISTRLSGEAFGAWITERSSSGDLLLRIAD
jgi:hypothetical protein